ncbi:hypothetical protein MGG_02305 [Pyricularia oryzae 70-15]|uniref:Uncharacterized protein n=1 Tax=Pyricularia oryzae (strain 70-15 / ATCC MYA-4617 / FGSC 8958) TaxID=242507 RepID=G4MQG9_PYRO7|nr:uncharacterized protein MGG_02305 [Pyricularia oryzae 70-15]EHA56459.1 hypothetical protein MGG_02305 [Pyricularia oryzae 70-15]
MDKPPMQGMSPWESIAFYFPQIFGDSTNAGFDVLACGEGTSSSPFSVCNSGVPLNSFTAEWVHCSFPHSGSYFPVPLYVFYAMSFVAITCRAESWAAPIALTSIMAYSATTAIHALVLAAVSLTDYISRLSRLRSGYEVVLVGGVSLSGTLERGGGDGPVWLPLIPMVFDPDTDLINLVLGFTYLCIIPLYRRSVVYKNLTDTPRKRLLAWVWIFLVTAGFVAGFGTSVYMQIWYSPQVRFCPARNGPIDAAGAHDKLPAALQGPNEDLESWNPEDWYRWNRTAPRVFGNESTMASAMRCLYPSADFWWPTRDPAEIQVKAFLPRHLRSGRTPPAFDEVVIVGSLVLFFTSAFANLLLYFTRNSPKARIPGLLWPQNGEELPENRFLLALEVIASVVIPVAGLVLAVMMNIIVWKDPRNEFYEGFTHLGQWGFLCNILLFAGGVFVAGPDGESNQMDDPPAAPEEDPLADLA